VPHIFDNIELKRLEALLTDKRSQCGAPPAGNANFARVQQEESPI
jgi:hypothetical protein